MSAFLTPLTTGLNVRSAREEASEQARVANANAAAAEREAEIEAQEAEIEIGRTKEQTRRQIGSIRARQAASGVVTTEGSPLLAQLDQAFEGRRAVGDIERQSGFRQESLREEARQSRAGAAAARRRGRRRATGAILTGLSQGAQLASSVVPR